MSIAYQLAYVLEKQAISGKLVARMLSLAKADPQRWSQLADKTRQWLPGAIRRSSRELTATGVVNSPVPVGSPALDAAVSRMVGSPTAVKTLQAKTPGQFQAVANTGGNSIALTDAAKAHRLGPAVVAHEAGHMIDAPQITRQYLARRGGIASSRETWRNELMANRRASQALRRPELVQGFQDAGVTMPSAREYLRLSKEPLESYRLSELRKALHHSNITGPATNNPGWINRAVLRPSPPPLPPPVRPTALPAVPPQPVSVPRASVPMPPPVPPIRPPLTQAPSQAPVQPPAPPPVPRIYPSQPTTVPPASNGDVGVLPIFGGVAAMSMLPRQKPITPGQPSDDQ